MKKASSSVKCQQFHLALAHRRPRSCFERINTVKTSGKTNTPEGRCQNQQEIHLPESQKRSLSENCERLNLSSHDCVCLESSEIEDNAKNGRKISQQILVSSALRRPHASRYSQLDSQTFPEQARPPRQPYRPKSACTVYSYAERPVSASETSSHLGRHTKASLLRSKSTLEITRPHHTLSGVTVREKKTCNVRAEYMLHQNLLTPKEVFDYMKSVHSYLTGARYNRSRLVDSKSLSKLGVYISKDGLNTFIMNKPKVAAKLVDDDVPTEVAQKVLDSKSPKEDVVTVGTNTDPHYLSLDKWHGAEWNNANGKKQMKPIKEDYRGPVSPNKIRPVQTQYINYNSMLHVRRCLTAGELDCGLDINLQVLNTFQSFFDSFNTLQVILVRTLDKRPAKKQQIWYRPGPRDNWWVNIVNVTEQVLREK